MRIVHAIGSVALVVLGIVIYPQPESVVAQSPQGQLPPQAPEVPWEVIVSFVVAGTGGFWAVWQMVDGRLDTLDKELLLTKAKEANLRDKITALEIKVNHGIADAERRTHRNGAAISQIFNVLHAQGLMQPRNYSGGWPGEDVPTGPFVAPSPPPREEDS